MAQRLGHALGWLFTALAMLAGLLGYRLLDSPDAGFFLMVVAVFWLIGRGLRYVLAGDFSIL
jgi:hypothetical protein